MNVKYLILITICVLLIVPSCRREYEDILLKYLQYQRDGKLNKAYALLSAKDKKIVDYDTFVGRENTGSIAEYLAGFMTFKILKSKNGYEGTSAVVRVEIGEIDLVMLYGYIPALLNDSLSGDEKRALLKSNTSIIKNCYKKSRMNYDMVLEDNGWKVFANFLRKRKIVELFEQADAYYGQKLFRSAFDIYNEILDFDTNDRRAVDKIRELQEVLNYIQDFMKYSYDLTKLDDNKVRLDVRVRNNGTFLVKDVFVQFIFLDGTRVVFKENFEFFKYSETAPNIGHNHEKEAVITLEVPEYTDVICRITAVGF